MLRNLSRICHFSSRYLHPYRNELFAVRAPLLRSVSVEGRRYLYSTEYLGIENFKRDRLEAAERFGSTKSTFICRMREYMNSSESNTIFTDDLKSAMCLAESDDDIEVTLQMVRRFHSRNLELKFSEFQFGPPLMRLLYMKNMPDLAYKLFTDVTLAGIFQQVTSYLILMNLLYITERYEQVMDVMDSFSEQPFEFQGSCATVAIAACHKLNSAQAFDKALSLLKQIDRPSLKAVALTALMALTQRKPTVAHELVSSVHVKNPMRTPVVYVNVKALTLAALGRADDAIQTLRVVIEQDVPDHVRRHGEIFQEVLTAVGDVSREFGNKEVQRQFAMTEKALRDGGFITERTLNEALDEPIARIRRPQDGYKHRPRSSVTSLSRQPADRTVYRRPGLLDY